MRNRADWTKLIERRAAAQPDAIAEIAERKISTAILAGSTPKYGNRAVIVDGYRFDSRLEADRYRELIILRADGAVLWFVRQVPFHLAPRVTYRADFLVAWRNVYEMAKHAGEGSVPTVTVEDTKGYLTEAARAKLALVESLFGVTVRLLRRADVQRFGGGV